MSYPLNKRVLTLNSIKKINIFKAEWSFHTKKEWRMKNMKNTNKTNVMTELETFLCPGGLGMRFDEALALADSKKGSLEVVASSYTLGVKRALEHKNKLASFNNLAVENSTVRNEVNLDKISTELYRMKVLSDTLISILDDLGEHVGKFQREEKDAAHWLAHELEIEWEKMHCLSSIVRNMARETQLEIDER